MGEIIKLLKTHTHPLQTPADLEPLINRIDDSKFVLLGEASHGTHEYYTWRTIITKRLIQEKKFSFIAVEGDWPDCYRLNRYVKGYPDAGQNAFEVLKTFHRWPTWMWANWEIVALAEWLREYNAKLPLEQRVGFYGLDVYSLSESLEAILQYMEKKDRHAYETTVKAASCIESFGGEGENYARSTYLIPTNCENEVVSLLREIRSKISQYNTDRETVFNTEQNALVAVQAENYYRAMVRGGAASWNIRDMHMVNTLNRLMKFHGDKAKAIVWEHNTHIGDARATDMAREGMVNVGELVTREHHTQGVVKVGFSSFSGKVIAGRNWGDTMRTMPVPEAQNGSWDNVFHLAGADNKLVLLDAFKFEPLFQQPRSQRAIGVVYNPDNERLGNYVPSLLPFRYEAMIYFDQTKPLHPLHITPDGLQVPETYPFGV